MSMVTSCTLLSVRPAVRLANSSASQVQSGRSAAVAPLSSQRRSRTLSVCFANNPRREYNPKTDLHPFNISPVVLVNHVPPRGDRWQLEEDAEKVELWFEVPGQSKEDLAVEIDEDVLVIKKKITGDQKNGDDGEKRENNKAAGGGAGSGQDARTAAVNSDVIYARLLLPAGYSKEDVKAELKSGELRVTIKKVKEKARRRISVNIDTK